MNRNYCFTSSAVFALVALLHAWRYVLDLPLTIGVWNVPRVLSGFAAIAAGCLAIWAYRIARSPVQATVYS
jgi:hypothetical protein